MGAVIAMRTAPRRRLAALLVAAAVLAPSLVLAAEGGLALSIADERPLRDRPVRIELARGGAPAAGAVVRAVYRPNSSTTHTETLPPADSAGTVFWTPVDAGPVTLQAWPGAPAGDPAATLTVAVRFERFPPSGLLIMVVAGVLLLGGAIYAMVMLLLPNGHPPAEEPPST